MRILFHRNRFSKTRFMLNKSIILTTEQIYSGHSIKFERPVKFPISARFILMLKIYLRLFVTLHLKMSIRQNYIAQYCKFVWTDCWVDGKENYLLIRILQANLPMVHFLVYSIYSQRSSYY